MIKIDRDGEYKVLHFRQKWIDIYEEKEVKKKWGNGTKRVKDYLEIGNTGVTDAYEFQAGDIILSSKYYAQYYNITILRKVRNI